MAVCFSKHELKLINNGFDHWSNNLRDRYDTTTLLAPLHVTCRNENLYKIFLILNLNNKHFPMRQKNQIKET